MRNKKIISTITLGLIGATLLSACNVSGSDTVAETDLTILSAASAASDTLATTETAIVTETTKAATPTPTEKPTVTPTVTPTTVPETSATTTATTAAPTAKPTKAPTQPTQTTAPAATTKATEPAPTTTKSTTPTYKENPDAIRDGIIQYCKDNGLWYPDVEVKGSGSKGYAPGYFFCDQDYINSFIKGKIRGDVAIVSVSYWIETTGEYKGYLFIACEIGYFPTPAPTAPPAPVTTSAPTETTAPPPSDTPTPAP